TAGSLDRNWFGNMLSNSEQILQLTTSINSADHIEGLIQDKFVRPGALGDYVKTTELATNTVITGLSGRLDNIEDAEYVTAGSLDRNWFGNMLSNSEQILQLTTSINSADHIEGLIQDKFVRPGALANLATNASVQELIDAETAAREDAVSALDSVFVKPAVLDQYMKTSSFANNFMTFVENSSTDIAARFNGAIVTPDMFGSVLKTKLASDPNFTTLSAKVTSNTNNITLNTNNISANATLIGAHEGRINSAESDVKSMNTTLGKVVTRVNATTKCNVAPTCYNDDIIIEGEFPNLPLTTDE
ncbi:MAG: hypothetical protein IIV74_04285, partial [Alphaproteobacteria bacterium]|nr:hypothetical protein [Alphaproteobacteria bacterium]